MPEGVLHLIVCKLLHCDPSTLGNTFCILANSHICVHRLSCLSILHFNVLFPGNEEKEEEGNDNDNFAHLALAKKCAFEAEYNGSKLPIVMEFVAS